jgi:hypothetical protein
MPLNMIDTHKQIAIALDLENRKLEVSYERRTDRALFDICDPSGRIVQTGALTSNCTSICLKHLEALNYVFLILDGDRVSSTKFSLRA